MNQSKLEEIAESIATEIRNTGKLVVKGQERMRSTLAKTPYSGFCQHAVEKVAELLPEYEIEAFGFKLGPPFEKGKKHVVALVKTEVGKFTVDPTIRQYFPNAKMVYSPQEKYPIKVVGGSDITKKL